MLTLALVGVLTIACGGSDSSTALATFQPGDPVPAITGTVTDANLRPVGGGAIEISKGGVAVQTIAVSAGGSYTVPALSAGSYVVRLHPPLAYSLGESEPVERNVDVAANSAAPVSVNFVVQAALYADDFQSYTSINQIIGGCEANIPPGNFFGSVRASLNCSNQRQMALDLTGGPNGTKALRYDWPSRPTCPNGPTNCSYYVALFPRLIPLQAAGTSELWVRFTDRLSPNFRIGGSVARGAQAEYKYLFMDLGQYGGVGQAVMELDSQEGGAPNNLVQARFKMGSPNAPGTATDGLPGLNGGLDAKLPADFFGTWNTWVLGLTGLGTAQVTFWAYRNGELLKSITGPFFPNQPVDVNSALSVEMGANINNGPDEPQSRWWRELGIYKSRPSLLPLVR